MSYVSQDQFKAETYELLTHYSISRMDTIQTGRGPVTYKQAISALSAAKGEERQSVLDMSGLI